MVALFDPGGASERGFQDRLLRQAFETSFRDRLSRQAFETSFPKTKDAFDKFLIGCFSTLLSQSAIFLELYFLELYFE